MEKAPPLDSYFKSKEEKIIFALIYLDGQIRADLLSIKEEMYESKKKGKYWYSRLVKIVHPDHCKHPLASNATAKLNAIYERMSQYAE
ncbi:hypothetical protein CBP51_02290 [Cellvibrio mixtus]|uniref:J domain-containing protein n=1 Tax=Cellvibrio mixtus TaxID=39650 RepID=A0A266Q7M1_9GAMM|nr:hypothetical protein [Cellvibrio mixtus]OZY85887.1 hypothetical protein CBP51_02290 [Cellvibrio mixtus]